MKARSWTTDTGHATGKSLATERADTGKAVTIVAAVQNLEGPFPRSARVLTDTLPSVGPSNADFAVSASGDRSFPPAKLLEQASTRPSPASFRKNTGLNARIEAGH